MFHLGCFFMISCRCISIDSIPQVDFVQRMRNIYIYKQKLYCIQILGLEKHWKSSSVKVYLQFKFREAEQKFFQK